MERVESEKRTRKNFAGKNFAYLSQAYSQTPWRKQKQLLGLFLVGVVFFALIAGVWVTITAQAGEMGRQVQTLQATTSVDEQLIADLKASLGVIYSSEIMEARARAMGFQPMQPDQTVYLLVPGYIDRQPANLAPTYTREMISAPSLPPEYTESLFVWLEKQFNRRIFPLFKVQP